MAGKPMRLDPVGVRGGGGKMGAAGDDLRAVLDKLKAALDAEGECWGQDESGQQFAHSYVPGKNSTVEALDKVAGALGDFMTNLKQTADDIESRDDRARSDFGKIQPPSV